MALLKILIVFAVIMLVMRFKLPLYAGLAAGIVAVTLLYTMPIAGAAQGLADGVFSVNTLLLLLAVYFIYYVQCLMGMRGKIQLTQTALNGLLNDRRLIASVTPACLGVLPSGAIVYTACDIVKDVSDGYLDKHEQAVVASFFRHIPEAFLPTFTNIILALNLSGISSTAFLPAMIIPVLSLFALGYMFFLRKLPRGVKNREASRGKSFKDLFSGIWVLALILALNLALGLHVAYAALIGIIVFIIFCKMKGGELAVCAKNALEIKVLINTVAAMAFRGVLEASGALTQMTDFLGGMNIAPWLAFAALFFFGALVAGSQAITAMGIPLAFSAMPTGGVPLLVLLLGCAYAAMQISPTHVCIMMACDRLHSDFNAFVRKIMPLVLAFCAFLIAYYLALAAIFR